MSAIVVTESIALGAVDELLTTHEGELRTRFPSFFRKAAEHLPPVPDSGKAEAVIRKHCPQALLVRPGEGGFFNALWELCETAEAGCEVELLKIPVRQETIEILDFFQLNPYYSLCAGTLLFAADEGERLVAELREEGIPAVVIGFLRKGRRREIRCREHIRCLDRPQAEEMEKVRKR
ncbi:MAG: AIR synthase-related protein [Lachnospiraceae bacterium]|nr:AIR synthase-related protein [Lachnospiraceae bacterium]